MAKTFPDKIVSLCKSRWNQLDFGGDQVHICYNGFSKKEGRASFSFRSDRTMREGSFGARAKEVAEFEDYEFYLDKIGKDEFCNEFATILPTTLIDKA